MKQALAHLVFVIPFFAACTATPRVGVLEESAASVKASSFQRLFPHPTAALSIQGTSDAPKSGATTLAQLLAEMERICPVGFVVDAETRQILERVLVGNLQSIVVPPDRVWSIFESLLCERSFCLGFVSTEAPILLSVNSTQPMAGRGSGARDRTIQVPFEELSSWSAHPAFMIATTVELNHLNVRDLSNSMRQMFTDPTTQQIIPIGNSNSLMLVGRASSVVGLVGFLRNINEAERVRDETEDKLSQEARDKAASRSGVARRQ